MLVGIRPYNLAYPDKQIYDMLILVHKQRRTRWVPYFFSGKSSLRPEGRRGSLFDDLGHSSYDRKLSADVSKLSCCI